jgi:hemoglobin
MPNDACGAVAGWQWGVDISEFPAETGVPMYRHILLPLAGLALALTVATAVGCSSNKSSADKSLYDRLGGEPAITAVVSDFVDRAAADPKVNFTRQGIAGAPKWDPTPENIAKLKLHLTQFVCVAAGGPQTYEGRPNKDVHTGMKITDDEFAAIAADLKASLDKFNVPQKEQDELMAAVGGTKDQIVGL